ncbi:hypothetical protein B0I35DRAFT_450417 [Stachybotrys elegans]|uniref:C6 zinc finger domain protein n=1 Tax=Stachybotrys elegans TaxID=80388 RepID=A0A8K0WT03_9HYPO|nr:hypothetical protein B0I35DRAFT_450417 [Stachybotrys elegans]
MRVLVESMWQSCGALHHTIQSMAAACLARDFPYLAAVAYREHVQAIDYVKSRSSDTPCDEATLLACMLLGHTASWLNPQNLATDMFRESCELLKDMAARRYSEDSHSFFSNTVDYWAMLLAFLTGRDELGDYQTHATARPPRPPGALDPHPYSGISRETVQLLTEIGLVIFAYRKHMANITFMAESDVEVFKSALRQARYLEMRLTEHRTLDLSQVKELGDRRTTLDHLQLIDEAYRCTGLLQLYRVFPDLLRLRYAPWSKENLLLPGPAVKTPTAEERQEWLTKLAVHTLDILRDIPFESHTRSVQPFIMVALSGELKYTDLGPDGTPVACPASIEVMTARKFIYSRLVAYSHIFPIRKTQVILELITHIWSQADAGHDVYWADVAHGRNLGTMMG